jgi:hypothetical protein
MIVSNVWRMQAMSTTHTIDLAGAVRGEHIIGATTVTLRDRIAVLQLSDLILREEPLSDLEDVDLE